MKTHATYRKFFPKAVLPTMWTNENNRSTIRSKNLTDVAKEVLVVLKNAKKPLVMKEIEERVYGLPSMCFDGSTHARRLLKKMIFLHPSKFNLGKNEEGLVTVELKNSIVKSNFETLVR